MTRVRVHNPYTIRYDPNEQYIDCPNPMCDSDCNVCMSTGRIGNPYYRFGDEDDDDSA